MAEKYLKWIMLREIIGEYLSNFRSEEVDSMKFFFCGKEYNVEHLRADYIRLTKELLKDYEV